MTVASKVHTIVLAAVIMAAAVASFPNSAEAGWGHGWHRSGFGAAAILDGALAAPYGVYAVYYYPGDYGYRWGYPHYRQHWHHGPHWHAGYYYAGYFSHGRSYPQYWRHWY